MPGSSPSAVGGARARTNSVSSNSSGGLSSVGSSPHNGVIPASAMASGGGGAVAMGVASPMVGGCMASSAGSGGAEFAGPGSGGSEGFHHPPRRLLAQDRSR